MSAREVERYKKTKKIRTRAPKIERREWINKKTGETHQVTVGIDPGWDYHVGQAGFAGMGE